MGKLKLNQLLICAGIIVSLHTVCAAVDTLTVNQTIRNWEMIVSANGNFELGFFSPNDSNNRFLGIWSKTISPPRQYMWVSNAGNPINDTSGVLKLSSDGRLLLLISGDIMIWASGFPDSNIIRPVAQLLDTGNLVLRDDQENVIWQSNPNYDVYVRSGICGPGGTCNSNNSPVCRCLSGFEPRWPEEWRIANWSSGCRRIEPLDCVKDAFRKFSPIKLPYTRSSWYNVSMTLEECQTACERNCSCTAYAIRDIQSGCLLWFGDLEDMRENGGGRELYVRLTASELEGSPSYESKNKKVIKVVLSTSITLLVACLILALYIWRKKKRSTMLRIGTQAQTLEEDYTNESQKEPAELPSYSLSKIVNSTNNFSINNMLGQGGFGPVYKGVLEGREIAVKRLSKTSSQGFDEFKNEVRCIAKLQHRNLVKLLGYCIQGDEFMLIYEYMPNKSLDSFIFDEVKSLMLDWPSRFHIIHGIARGLLYLHQDSRLRIIHRDLKAGNILLDHDMNPKISDFGLARRFRGQENEANTNKVDT
ncbi:G-type lectin S-receptor-like serine/threonine-protein kinase At4g27290 [Bidens hawaiensis]|uniref:G-type lectin S-receptor-like serine/threonine-protein kinase At4g27290 n=1 Tax=Bidens hawaiensis TaxID=980011 RepID=UPI00404A0CD6